MSTLTFQNPTHEQIAFFENLRLKDPDIEIIHTFTVITPKYSAVVDETTLPVEAKPKKRGAYKKRTSKKNTKAEAEIKRNHDLIWGPETPETGSSLPSDD